MSFLSKTELRFWISCGLRNLQIAEIGTWISEGGLEKWILGSFGTKGDQFGRISLLETPKKAKLVGWVEASFLLA